MYKQSDVHFTYKLHALCEEQQHEVECVVIDTKTAVSVPWKAVVFNDNRKHHLAETAASAMHNPDDLAHSASRGPLTPQMQIICHLLATWCPSASTLVFQQLLWKQF